MIPNYFMICILDEFHRIIKTAHGYVFIFLCSFVAQSFLTKRKWDNLLEMRVEFSHIFLYQFKCCLNNK